jgi:hypothetical protein
MSYRIDDLAHRETESASEIIHIRLVSAQKRGSTRTGTNMDVVGTRVPPRRSIVCVKDLQAKVDTLYRIC